MFTKHSFNGAIRAAWTLLLFVSMATFASAQGETPSDSTKTETPEKVGKETKSDTTEIEFKNKKFVIITDGQGKRFTIEEANKSDESDDEDFDWESSDDEDDEDYDPDYDNKSKSSRKRSEVEFLALDLGVTNYYRNGEFGVDAASPQLEVRTFRPGSHVALHFLPTRVSLIGRGAVNLKTALTVDWTNLYFTNPITIQRGQDQLTIVEETREFTKNKLMSRYFQIPLMLNFNTDPGGDDGLSVSVGGYAGVFWKARTRQESDELGTVKFEDDFNLNPFRYGLTARVDFKWFDFYANYNLSSLFEEGSSPVTNTFNVGVNIINF